MNGEGYRESRPGPWGGILEIMMGVSTWSAEAPGLPAG